MDLKEFIVQIDLRYPLANLCENIEESFGGELSYKELYDVLESKYSSYCKKEELREFVSRLSFEDLDISQKSPLIQLYDLFKYFSATINLKIVSPIISLYKFAKILTNTRQTPSSFFKLRNKKNKNDVNLLDFQEMIIGSGLNEIDMIVIFKSLDHNKCGRMNLDELAFVLESYMQEEEKFAYKLTQSELNAFLLKDILDKNFIDLLAQVFDSDSDKPLERAVILSRIKENFIDASESQEKTTLIIEAFLNDVFTKENTTSFSYGTLMKYMPKYEDSKNKRKRHVTFLSDYHFFIIDKYLRILSKVNQTAEDVIEYLFKDESGNSIELEKFRSYLKVIVPVSLMTTADLNSIVEVLDINSNGVLEKTEYNNLLAEFYQIKEAPKSSIHKKTNIDLANIHLLPVKGNIKLLKKIKVELNRAMIFNGAIEKTMRLKVDSSRENPLDRSMVSTTSELNMRNYNDADFTIRTLESFEFSTALFACYDLLNYINLCNDSWEGGIKKKTMAKIVHTIDSDNDGFISGKDIVDFMIAYLKHYSVIVATKYIKSIVNDENSKSTSLKYFKKNFSDFDEKKEIEEKTSVQFLETQFGLDRSICEAIVEDIIDKNQPVAYYLCLAFFFDKDESSSSAENSDDGSKPSRLVNLEEIDMNSFESNINEIVKNILYCKISTFENSSKEFLESNFIENLCTILSIKNTQEDIVYTYSEYKKNFLSKLHIKIDLGNIIFDLLKKASKVEPTFGKEIVTLFDLKLFFLSFLPKKIKFDSVYELINHIEKNGVELKCAIEAIPFNQTGYVSVVEIMKILKRFYPNFGKSVLKCITAELDTKKTGYVSYSDIHLFLFSYSNSSNFSYITELKNIMSKLLSKNLITSKSQEYFQNDHFCSKIHSFATISLTDHTTLFSEFCENEEICSKFFNCILEKQGRENDYDLNFVCEDLNYFYISSEPDRVDSVRT